MATTMDFAQVGFLVLLCLSFCTARRVLTETTNAEKPNFARSFQATQNTHGFKSGGGISSLDDSKWQSGGKGSHCSGGGGGGGGGGNACCGGNEGCGGCGNFGGGGGGGGGYCGGCGSFACGGGGGGGSYGGNGGCDCGYACGSGGGGGNYQGGCYCPPPPTCGPVTCPPVSNCCPVGCPPSYGHPKVAAQHWATKQAPPKPQITLTGNNHDVQPGYEHPKVAAHHWTNSLVPPSPKVTAQHWANSQAPPRPEIALTGNNQDHEEQKPNIQETENVGIHSEPRFNADNDSNPNYSDKETQLGKKTEIYSKNEPAPPGSDGQVQEDVSKNESMN